MNNCFEKIIIFKFSEKIIKMASGDAAVAAQTVWAMRTDKVFVAFEVGA